MQIVRNLEEYVLEAIALACIVGASVPPEETCEGPTHEGIREVGPARIFQSPHLDVDADGAPNAYRLDGKGLSYTCDGVVAIENGRRVTRASDPKHWQAKCNAAWSIAKSSGDYSRVAIFGFETGAQNQPRVQQVGDPFPGEAYISTTSYSIPGAPENTQRRYVDATRIPYVVLPKSMVRRYALAPGTIAVVYRPSTGNFAFGVYADSGLLGEGSIKLHQDLGNEPIVFREGIPRAKNRIEDAVLTFVFPRAKSSAVADAKAWNASIQEAGWAALNQFGGVPRLESCTEALVRRTK